MSPRRSQSVAQQVKIYTLVTLISVMVWVVAEGQTLQRQSTEVTLGFVGTQQYATAVETPGWSGRVEVTFEGSASSVKAIEALLREPLTLSPGQDGLPTDDGVHTIDLRASLRGHSRLRDSAIAIAGVEPRSVAVKVTGLERIEQTIEVVLPEGVEASSISVNPATVMLSAPTGTLAGASPPRVVLDPAVLAGLPQGRAVTLSDQPIRLSGLVGVRMEPTTAQVILELRTRTDQLVIPSVPVALQMPAIEATRWIVEVPDAERVIRNVTLIGPASAIESYRKGERELIAVVRLGFEELETGITSKRAEFPGLPAGVRVEVEDQIVDLKIQNRPLPEG
jgi:hypothetical protein